MQNEVKYIVMMDEIGEYTEDEGCFMPVNPGMYADVKTAREAAQANRMEKTMGGLYSAALLVLDEAMKHEGPDARLWEHSSGQSLFQVYDPQGNILNSRFYIGPPNVSLPDYFEDIETGAIEPIIRDRVKHAFTKFREGCVNAH